MYFNFIVSFIEKKRDIVYAEEEENQVIQRAIVCVKKEIAYTSLGQYYCEKALRVRIVKAPISR